MTQYLKIDFVLDVARPWCVIGLRRLEQAVANAADAVEADITFQPFEFSPRMPECGNGFTGHHHRRQFARWLSRWRDRGRA